MELTVVENIYVKADGAESAKMVDAVKEYERRFAMKEGIFRLDRFEKNALYDSDERVIESSLDTENIEYDIKEKIWMTQFYQGIVEPYIAIDYFLPYIEELGDSEDFKKNFVYKCMSFSACENRLYGISFNEGKMRCAEFDEEIAAVESVMHWSAENCRADFVGLESNEGELHDEAYAKLIAFREKYCEFVGCPVLDEDGCIGYEEWFVTDNLMGLREDVIELIEYAKANGFSLSMTGLFIADDGESVAGAVLGTDDDGNLEEGYTLF